MTISKLVLLCLLVLAVRSYSQETIPAHAADTTGEITEKIFERAEIEAEFPGSFTGWKKYVEQNLKTNIPVENDAPVGIYIVYVEFIVDRDGIISDIKPLTKLGFGMEEEVIRLIKESGAWTPGIVNGRAVKSWRKQHVTFLVTADKYDIFSHQRYVLFTEIDNNIIARANKVKNRDIQLFISEGSLTSSGKGRYIVHVSKPGRITIDIYDAKKKKPIGKVSFEVKSRKELRYLG